MGILQDIVSEIQTNIVAATGLITPPSGGTNFFTAVNGLSQNFLNALAKSNVLLPCVVLEIGDFSPDTEYGVGDVLCKRLQVTAHYIAKVAAQDGTQDGVCEQAINIGVQFDVVGQPFSTFQVIEPCTIISNIDSAINAPLAGVSKVSVVSAQASWTPGFQVQFETPLED